MSGGSERRASHAGLKTLLVIGVVVAFGLSASAGDGVSAAQPGPGAPYAFNFSGNPSSPQPWNPATWDIAVSNRAPTAQLESMQAQHGSDCSPSPATHYNDTFEGAVFLCRNHVMTAINAKGYGEIALTPDHMVDFSGGAATIRFDLSTLRTSYRDWIDIWITPFADNLVLPLDFPVDLQGPPARGIQVKMDQNFGTIFRAYRFDNFKTTPLRSDDSKSVDKLQGTTSANTRTTFELTISPTHLRFGAPTLGFNWVDTGLTGLGWTRGIVQLVHHSYNPTKDCKTQGLPTCLPNTWHWSNFSISKAVPFTLLRGDQQAVYATSPAVVKFPASAPASSFLRFAAVGSIDFSVDGGKTWQPAHRQAQLFDYVEHFSSFWTPIAAGTKSVTFRGHNWPGGPWWIRDVALWSTIAAIRVPATAEGPTAAPAIAAGGKTPPLQAALAALRSPIAVGSIAALVPLVLSVAVFAWWIRRRRRRVRSQ